MGWLLYSLVLLVLLTLISHVWTRMRKSSNKQSDYALDQRIKKECKDTTLYTGQFDIGLSDLANTDWLDLSDYELTPEDFSYAVKWRNYGTRYSYRIIATCSDETDDITLTSKKTTVKCS